MAISAKSAAAIKSMAAKAASKGVSASTINAAANKVGAGSVVNSGGSTVNKTTTTPTKAPSIQETIAKAQAAGISQDKIDAALKSSGAGAKLASQTATPAPATPPKGQIAASNNTAIQQGMTAAEYAAKFPGAPNPYSSGEGGDIAMAGVKPTVKSSDLTVKDGEAKATGDLTLGEPTLPDTSVDNSFTEYQSDLNTQIKDDTSNKLNETEAYQQSVIQGLQNSNNQVTQEKAAIIQNRFANAEQAFAQINDRMAKLEDAAKNVFDQGAARAAIAQARQMAEQGFITNDQVSAVANFAVADYRRAADLQRAELEQEIQTQYIDILKEKQSIVDSIMADQSMDLTLKQQYASQVAQMYNELSNNMMNAYTGIQNQFGAAQGSVTAPYIGVEAGAQQAVTGKEVEQQLQDMDVSRALKGGALEKTNFILDFANTKVNSNLSPYIMEILRTKFNDPAFSNPNMSAEQFNGLLADIISQANKKYAAANTSSSQGFSGISNQPQGSTGNAGGSTGNSTGGGTPFIDTSTATGKSMPFSNSIFSPGL